MEKKENASFHLFKPSGKWGYSGRGHLSEKVFGVFRQIEQRQQLLADNGGKMPGINGDGEGYTVVVVGDDDLPHGWPLHLNAQVPA
jgi:hypothetical protein